MNKNLSDPMEMLDIGTGTGMVQRIVSENTCIFGIDKSLKMIEKNVGKNLFIKIVGEACHLPIKNNTFSLVSAIGLTEYISDKDLFLQEIKRVLLPEGYFLVTIAPPSPLNKIRNLLGNRIYAVKAEKWETLTGKKGFICIEQTQSLLQVQYLLRLKKLGVKSYGS